MFNLLYLAGSLGARISAVLLVTILLARALSPELFGALMIGATLGGFAGILADLGGSISALRNMGANEASASLIINRSFSAKLTIVLALVALSSVGAAIFLGLSVRSFCFFAGFVGMVTTSLGDLAIVSFRALQRNREEFLVNVISNLSSVLIFWLGSLCTRDPFVLCVIYIVSRLSAFALILFGVAVGAGIVLRFRLVSIRKLARHARASGSWALYVNAAYLNAQIDAVSVTYLFGTAANGIYQSAARFMSGAGQIPGIANSYWIPRIAREKASRGNYVKLQVQAGAAIVAAGVIVFGAFAWIGPLITIKILPSSYHSSLQLWVPLGALLLCRFIAAAGNIRVVTSNLPHISLIGEMVALSINIVGLMALAPRMGMFSVPLVLAVGAIGTFVSSMVLLAFQKKD